ncbi:MAG TPA: hypothetical protein VK348_15220 [Planctomycetota bacterium]|nr:hypothetical protein [Planctomycetota bacterium]
MMHAIAAVLLAALVTPQQQAKAQERVLVLGEAGVTSVDLDKGETVLSALAKAEPKPTAALECVVLVRFGEREVDHRTLVVDAAETTRSGQTSKDFRLVAADTLLLLKKPVARAPAWTRETALQAAFVALLARELPKDRRAWLQKQLLMRSTDRAVRQQMAVDLAQSADRRLAVEQLVSVLDLDANVACEAVTALGTMGTAARAALPDLARLRDHSDPRLRACVSVAIRQIEGVGKPR